MNMKDAEKIDDYLAEAVKALLHIEDYDNDNLAQHFCDHIQSIRQILAITIGRITNANT